MQRVSLMTNCSAICIVAILHFLMPMRVSESESHTDQRGHICG